MQRFLVKNSDNAAPMAKYMKNKFSFLGVKTPERKSAEKDLLQVSKEWDLSLLFSEIYAYYNQPEREYQYVAIDLLLKNEKRLSAADLENIYGLIDQKSWWDSVDALRKPISMVAAHS
ncbi:hypothetical protein IV88_GL000595 [Pediococcus argentinicus]|uniref:DNA alkylation repair enzyme n=1 Tax=Pediococcus argentinicus TaxID=480391 RepID=A0A0R2NK64_9LACO|nr:hypothetical protein IV88_GL000595 [Pediococcus argentinicus]GEP18754.1 hypothetical protein LSA03_01380 [Pediococcus argentinicus]